MSSFFTEGYNQVPRNPAINEADRRATNASKYTATSGQNMTSPLTQSGKNTPYMSANSTPYSSANSSRENLYEQTDGFDSQSSLQLRTLRPMSPNPWLSQEDLAGSAATPARKKNVLRKLSAVANTMGAKLGFLKDKTVSFLQRVTEIIAAAVCCVVGMPYSLFANLKSVFSANKKSHPKEGVPNEPLEKTLRILDANGVVIPRNISEYKEL